MKNSIMILALLLALIEIQARTLPGTTTVFNQLNNIYAEGNEYVLTGSENFINWIGSKPGGQHNGNVNITEGKLSVTGNAVSAGNFKFDLNTIKDLDLENPGYNAKLVGHLKSADFFDVEKFPVAGFEIVSVKSARSAAALKEGEVATNSDVTGNLTIKGITKSITFPARIILEKNVVSVTANPFSINRTSWGVNYQSKSIFAELKDKFIYDEIILSFNLKFIKK